jgi:hypothetical protein
METVSNFADVEGGDCAARRTGKMKSANLIRYSRTFTRLEEWEREVEMARIYAGFHITTRHGRRGARPKHFEPGDPRVFPAGPPRLSTTSEQRVWNS